MRFNRITTLMSMMLMALLPLYGDNSVGESALFTVNTSETIIDSDSDGLPDEWENENNLAVNSNDASQDPDGDGFTNSQEYNKSLSIFHNIPPN